MVDEERAEGTWRHVIIHNGGTYFLTDLAVRADGVVDCWGLVPFATFVEKVRSGRVATQPAEGAPGSAHQLASWSFSRPRAWVDADTLIGEVTDEIERLKGRPTGSARCMAALGEYLAEPAEERRGRLADVYAAVPAHLRVSAGRPGREGLTAAVLATPSGQPVERPAGRAERAAIYGERAAAMANFAQRREDAAAAAAGFGVPDPDGPDRAGDSVVRFDDVDGGLGFLSNGTDLASVREAGHLDRQRPRGVVVPGLMATRPPARTVPAASLQSSV
jgi:hypothetical protein